MSSFKSPAYNVKAVPVEKIVANSYNPNVVAPPEMKLLELSIWEDGYTMPLVCYYREEEDIYELVDGYHRYLVMKTSVRIYKRENGLLPVTVINKDISNRMASTIRHNRARGMHSLELMTGIVAELSKSGMSDSWIMRNIGMDKNELLRFKQISGLAELFRDRSFGLSDAGWSPKVSVFPCGGSIWVQGVRSRATPARLVLLGCVPNVSCSRTGVITGINRKVNVTSFGWRRNAESINSSLS